MLMVASSMWLAIANHTACAGDAYVTHKGNIWTMGTSRVERVVALENGEFILKSFKNKVTGSEMMPIDAKSDEFFLITENGPLTGSTGGWKLVDAADRKLAQGELKLDITLRRESLQVTKTYVLYPGSSIIREWLTFKNIGTTALRIIDPGFLNISAKVGDAGSLDFMWMTGGENVEGSWNLQKEKLSGDKARLFDSYDPYPISPSDFPGDGIKARIEINNKLLWPKEDWEYVRSSYTAPEYDVNAHVSRGDRISFIVNMNDNITCDTTRFDPTITYEGGEAHRASSEYGKIQGENAWCYQYIENGKAVDMVYNSEANAWKGNSSSDVPFINPNSQHPGNNQDVVRTWTAPRDGMIHIKGDVCNTGNGSGAAPYGHRPGSESFAPWQSLYGNDTGNGLFVGWDYFGHWISSVSLDSADAVTMRLKVAGYNKSLAPGESISTPKAFVGLYSDDLDNAGNECLDWQYRYLWDYTRDKWFPAIRMLGYWYKGTNWGKVPTGSNDDFDSVLRKIFRTTDLMRYCGADVYHRDWGWWNCAGEWNGPDFKSSHDYLAKHGMGQLLYAFLYSVSMDSKVAKEHPDWVIGSILLDMSKPEVVEFMKGQLDEFVRKWGSFEWRNDSFFTGYKDDDQTCMLGQDQGFRKVIKDFLDKHRDCAFQAVNAGGYYGGYDYTRFSSSFSFSDGGVGILRNYYASLLFPPDKTSDIPDRWNPDSYDKSIWMGLLCINFDMTGDTWNREKMEGVRQLIDIYHYLQHNGVVGRWVKVYRPTITGDDRTMYFQRLSGDRTRGIIIPKRPAPGVVTIRPKGLFPDHSYNVSFQESDAMETRTGADLMANGITIEKMIPGELIYLNLPMHPGSKLDKEPPTSPSAVNKAWAENMGFPGMEVKWQAGSDNNWLSCYEIFRDGAYLDKIAKGTFYFDHSAGADLAAEYEVRSVDGAGNTSNKVAAGGVGVVRSKIYDDSDLTLTGNWQHQSNLQPAYEGTVSFTDQVGDTAEIALSGKRILLFAKLNEDCGKAEISIDDGKPEVIDTYSTDDIWGVCVYKKELQGSGRHILRIKVLGEHSANSKGNFIYLDGIRVEQ